MSWFFETFVLSQFKSNYKLYDPQYDFIFNSYYYTHGEMHPRAKRGLLSRPTVEDVYGYRYYVNQQALDLMESISEEKWNDLAFRITLGLNHEQQHQELLLMDIKHNFSVNPLKPAYRKNLDLPSDVVRPVQWLERYGGLTHIGNSTNSFAYDNETPKHNVLVRDHLLADRFITNGEYLDFVEDGAYFNPALWLADGWTSIQNEKWQHPLYWNKLNDEWMQFTLGGNRRLNLHEPVCHLSFYEADAYARWDDKRLPTEAELESCLNEQEIHGNFLNNNMLHPKPATNNGQWFGDLWAWTSSPYVAHPGFKPLAGSMGEYNGKFMSNQMVLKGGSCVTPVGHTRASYRNFFYPNERWAFTGLRLAEDI